MKNLTSLTMGLIALAMITTMTTTTKTHVAEAEQSCRNLEDGTVVCSGGSSFGNVPGGGHTEEEPDGDTTRSGGGGRPGSNEEFLINGGRCEIGPGGDPIECVGEYNRND